MTVLDYLDGVNENLELQDELNRLREKYGELREDYTIAEDRIAELENLTTGLAKNAAWMSMELEKYQWVSVEDRLPEDSGEYLVYIVANNMPKNKSIITLYYTNLSKRFVYYDNDNIFTVTHWMPLPSVEGLNDDNT